LNITVDRDAEIPIGVQLAWALRSRIGDGRLQPGERLPGLRDAAEATGVNVNTVRAVYQRLEQEGLIDSQQGSGTFVASTPRRPSIVATIAADAAREAHETGVDPREVAAALYVSQGAPANGSHADSERRRALREQIATLERTLGELEAKHPGIAAGFETGRGQLGPALLGTAELESVRTHLLRRLAAAQAAIDALGSAKPTPQARARKQGAHERSAAGKRAGDTTASPGNGARGRAARPRPRMRPAPESA